MIKNVTLENLVLYYYNETDLTDSVLIQSAIDNNYFVAEEYKELKDAFSYLDKIVVSPSDSSVQNILKFSKMFN